MNNDVKEAAIYARGLCKQFNGLRVVDEVDLVLPRGRFMALLGPSGCGKTTLLRLIAGFEEPDTGALAIGGREVAGSTRMLPPEQRRVGMVFQDYALFPHLTAAQNIAHGLSRADRGTRRVDDLLLTIGLAGLGKRLPHELSSGQQQRVALARALAPRPDVLLLDEPFSNLDAGLRRAIRTEVRQIVCREGATVLFVTHDREEALSLADQVAVMLDGKIVQIDSPRSIYRHPATREVATFVGAANFLPGEVVDGCVACALGKVPLARPAHGLVDVLICPEMIALEPDNTSQYTIMQHTFFGPDQIVEVNLANGFSLQARLAPWVEVAAGQRVKLNVQGSVVVFPT